MKNMISESGVASPFRTGFAIAAALGCIAIVLSPLQSPVAHGQAYTTLLSFNGTNGNEPCGGLTLSGTTLYGVTYDGGSYGDGNVFSLPVTGDIAATMLSFRGANGANPQGGLTLNGSTLYGMTTYGGTNNCGTIFSIATSGGPLTTLFSFDGPNGSEPSGDLTLSGTTLYGMTPSGGSYGSGYGGYGTIFSIATSGGPLTALFSFDRTNGEDPYGGLTLSGATLYGMTRGGGDYGHGTIFSIATTGGNANALSSFIGPFGDGGQSPYGSLTLSGTTLYGMTSTGGTNDVAEGGLGTIFGVVLRDGWPHQRPCSRLTAQTATVRVGDLTLSPDGSTLYGMTEYGGANSLGTIFSIATSGGPLTTLFSFDGTNGEDPFGDLTLSPDGSTLYGMTSAGGAYGDGVVFSLTVPEPSTFALLGVGAVASLGYGWRQRRAK